MDPKQRNALLIGITLLLVAVAWFQFWPLSAKINQGLDLRGGASVILTAQPENGSAVSEETMKRAETIVLNRVNGFGVSEASVQRQGTNQDSILVQLPGIKNPQAAIDALGSTGKLEFVDVTKIKDFNKLDATAVNNGTATLPPGAYPPSAVIFSGSAITKAATGVNSGVNAGNVVTFQVDMTQQVAAGHFTNGVNAVNARGSFNNWGISALTNNPGGSNPNLYSGTFNDTSDADGKRVQQLTHFGCAVVYFNDASPGGATVTDNVTFQVDMSGQIALGHFTNGVNSVSVRGSFNGWGTAQCTNNPSAANPNLYSTAVAITDTAANTEHYKFCIDTTGWEYPSALSLDCTGNRVFNLLSTSGYIVLPAVYFADTIVPTATNTVTFCVDMSIQAALGRFTPGVDTVECRGSFNNWTAGAFVLTNNPNSASASNIYSGTVNIFVPPLDIVYKFWDSNAKAGNDGYESPDSIGGQNRSYRADPGSVSGHQGYAGHVHSEYGQCRRDRQPRL